MIKAIFLCCFISAVSISQTWTHVYRDFISPTLIATPQQREQIDARIEAASQIHPDLIYYELVRFSLLDSSRTQYELWSQYAQSIKYTYVRRRTQWAEVVASTLDHKDADRNSLAEARASLNSLLNYEFISTPMVQTGLAIDTSDIERIVLLFYSRGDTSLFSDSLTFPERRRLFESRTLSRLVDHTRHERISNDTPYLASLLNHWYLFDSLGCAVVGLDSIAFSDLLIRAVSAKYRITKVGELGLAIGMQSFIKNPLFTLAIHDPARRIDFEIPYTSMAFSLTSSYKYFFSQVPASFGYLKLQFSYSSVSGNVPLIFMKDRSGGREQSSSIYQYVNPQTFWLTDIFYFPWQTSVKYSISSALLSIAVPIVTFSPYVTVEPSICLQEVRFVYSAAFDYSYQRFDHDRLLAAADRSVDQREAYNQRKLGVSITVNARLLSNLIASFALLPNRFHLSAGWQM